LESLFSSSPEQFLQSNYEIKHQNVTTSTGGLTRAKQEIQNLFGKKSFISGRIRRDKEILKHQGYSSANEASYPGRKNGGKQEMLFYETSGFRHHHRREEPIPWRQG
jgi:hypothetical protein